MKCSTALHKDKQRACAKEEERKFNATEKKKMATGKKEIKSNGAYSNQNMAKGSKSKWERNKQWVPDYWAVKCLRYLRWFWPAWRLSWSRRRPRREPRWGCTGCRSGWWSSPSSCSGRRRRWGPHSHLGKDEQRGKKTWAYTRRLWRQMTPNAW